jgi:hypothetical protein
LGIACGPKVVQPPDRLVEVACHDKSVEFYLDRFTNRIGKLVNDRGRQPWANLANQFDLQIAVSCFHVFRIGQHRALETEL